jgi:hypothetical protein
VIVMVRAILQPGPGRWRLVALVLAFAALMFAGVLYTRHVQRESDRRWCDLLVTLDTAYRSQPPATELGRRVAAAMARLRADFGC